MFADAGELRPGFQWHAYTLCPFPYTAANFGGSTLKMGTVNEPAMARYQADRVAVENVAVADWGFLCATAGGILGRKEVA
jgi:hypothetical protein